MTILTLVNGCADDWMLLTHHEYQIRNWYFPQTVKAGTSSPPILVDWGTEGSKSDDGGEAEYVLPNGNKFEIQARAPHGDFTLQAWLSGITTQGNANGSSIPLGSGSDSNITWILSGHSGSYSSSS